ncbi:MAG: undecaprenyl-diphosphate phosphatase [Thermoleophilaceae bacterium]|nr:undecaprenyl-diphosphate phosphatase [Thermoleophilaceae bacterium]
MLLGLLQGPAELLPVSSSGHLALVPRLLGWDYPDLPAEARKTFEVAVHAGSAPAIALALRGGLGRNSHLLALTLLPPAAAGLLFEQPIERRLGGVGAAAACASALATLPLARGTAWGGIGLYRIALGVSALCIRARRPHGPLA